MFGYYNEFTFIKIKLLCKLFVKDKYNKLLGIKPMGLSDHRADSFEIIALQPVKKLLGINPMGINAPWADVLEIFVVRLFPFRQ